MVKHKVWTATAVAVGTLVLLTGCAAEGRSTDAPTLRKANLGGTITEGTITTNGRTVPCVTWVEGVGTSRVGGISCDWASATPVR